MRKIPCGHSKTIMEQTNSRKFVWLQKCCNRRIVDNLELDEIFTNVVSFGCRAMIVSIAPASAFGTSRLLDVGRSSAT